MGNPLAKVCGFGEDVKGFGGETDDGEGVESASVSRHEYKVVGGGAIGVEISPNDTILEHNILLLNVWVLGLEWWWRWECGGGGWWREGGAVAEILDGEGEMRREELEEGDERTEEEKRRQEKFELRSTVPNDANEHLLRVWVFNWISVFHHCWEWEDGPTGRRKHLKKGKKRKPKR